MITRMIGSLCLNTRSLAKDNTVECCLERDNRIEHDEIAARRERFSLALGCEHVNATQATPQLATLIYLPFSHACVQRNVLFFTQRCCETQLVALCKSRQMGTSKRRTKLRLRLTSGILKLVLPLASNKSVLSELFCEIDQSALSSCGPCLVRTKQTVAVT